LYPSSAACSLAEASGYRAHRCPFLWTTRRRVARRRPERTSPHRDRSPRRARGKLPDALIDAPKVPASRRQIDLSRASEGSRFSAARGTSTARCGSTTPAVARTARPRALAGCRRWTGALNAVSRQVVPSTPRRAPRFACAHGSRLAAPQAGGRGLVSSGAALSAASSRAARPPRSATFSDRDGRWYGAQRRIVNRTAWAWRAAGLSPYGLDRPKIMGIQLSSMHAAPTIRRSSLGGVPGGISKLAEGMLIGEDRDLCRLRDVRKTMFVCVGCFRAQHTCM
jgi:hypothetical protein